MVPRFNNLILYVITCHLFLERVTYCGHHEITKPLTTHLNFTEIIFRTICKQNSGTKNHKMMLRLSLLIIVERTSFLTQEKRRKFFVTRGYVQSLLGRKSVIKNI